MKIIMEENDCNKWINKQVKVCETTSTFKQEETRKTTIWKYKKQFKI